MTYQVLARKWRPKTFNDMAGQEHVLQTLVHALDNNRLHHAYLFTGTRGVGKTTIARIFARCLNCEQGVTSTPCGQCSACVEINEGRFIDLIEVDAASRTKVEDTRELLENVQYAPSRGRYKVYLIDEVHMLSTSSFNALLKTLEEPPPHVVFLLATTDPHKLPITILSRCLQFSLKNLSPQRIVDYLRSVLIAEQIPFEEGALWHLAKSAQGSMRDALTLLDQSISFCAGNVREAEVSELLGTPDRGLLVDILQALNAQDAAALLDTATTVSERSFDYFLLIDNLVALLHRVAMAQLVPGAVDNSQGDREQVLTLARAMTAEDVQLYYQIALQGRQDIGLAHDSRMAFEMLLLRMLVFSPQLPTIPAPDLSSEPASAGPSSDPAENTPQRDAAPVTVDTTPSAGEPDAEQKKKPELTQPKPGIDSAAALQQQPEQTPEQEPEQVIDQPPEQAAPQAAEQTPQQTTVQPPQEAPAQAEPPSVPGIEHWTTTVEQLGVTGITGNLIFNCLPESFDGRLLQLVLDEQQSSLYNEEQGRRIAQVLKGHFGAQIEVLIRTGALTQESPAKCWERQRQERRQQAINDFENDEHVQSLITHFAARILPDSIKVISEENR